MLLAIAGAFALGWVTARVDLRALLTESRSLPRSYFKGLNFLLSEQPDRAIEAFVEVAKVNADTLELDVSCSKGTYIRTLVADIGKELECGAHVASLCRESVAGFQKNQMISVPLIEELAQKQDFAALDKLLLPTESALFNYPEIKLTEAMTFYMRQGQAVLVPHSPKEGLVKLLAKDGAFLGVGEILSDGKIGPKRLIQKL